MTDIRQNFSLMLGDDLDVAFDITGIPPVNLSVAQSLIWTAYEEAAPAVADDTKPVVTKDLPGGGLTIIDPIAMTFMLHLFSADTTPLQNGNYVHMVVLTDQNGRKTTTTVGLMTVVDDCNQPNAVSFKTQFPHFASLDDTTVQIALDEAADYVDESWGDQQIPASMLLAAHFLSVAETTSATGGRVVTAERIGQISVNYAASFGTGGKTTDYPGLTTTFYGMMFLSLLRRSSPAIAVV